MTISQMKEKLSGSISPKRLKHSVGTMEKAAELAEKLGADVGQARTAGLLHDCARDLSDGEMLRMCESFGIMPDEICKLQPMLLHGVVGSRLAQTQFGVSDNSVLNAIAYHTMGHKGMLLLDKIIFLADYIEPGRNFHGVEIVRAEAEKGLDHALVKALDSTISYVLSKGMLVHPDTIDARNHIIMTASL